ncbi:hypothetical protein J437_LFUL015340 [Ladona fulva]|uniref:beta-N-acetylhexosaminidase n=1 Tax=Ladona fulva TaxID=123851 RepID=A0A8K0KIS3_LADFU|nr:hypothetical protein J437_LFUL015340 [Ladona fulva]
MTTGNNCDLLGEAFNRYQTILGIVNRQIPPTTTGRFRRHLDDNISGYLDTLEVRLTNPCEDLPHSEMDESCKRSNQEISDFMDSNGLTDNYAGLEEYYIQKLVDLVKNLNASSIVWQEVFDNGVNIDPNTVVQVWISTNSEDEMSKDLPHSEMDES